jgi:hypothetical protein
MRTVNRNRAMRVKQTLEAAGRRLPLLETVNDRAIDKLAEENLRGLAQSAPKAAPTNLPRSSAMRALNMAFHPNTCVKIAVLLLASVAAAQPAAGENDRRDQRRRRRLS